MTTPEQARTGLQLVTTAAKADIQTVAETAGQRPARVRVALFATAPLIVGEYATGAATLATDWYDELRDMAQPRSLFAPQPLVRVTEDAVSAAVAVATEPLYRIEQGVELEIKTALQESLAAVEAEAQKLVASAFRDTMTENATEDPDAEGWRRFARPGGCKFCQMLADKGAVYTEATVDFAAHTDCHCLAAPAFDPDAPKASVMQYVASKKRRTAKERAALRDYLNEHFPDARG